MARDSLPAQSARAWRTGRKVGRTIYAQLDPHTPSDHDPLIGVMDTPELAEAAVRAHNELEKFADWVERDRREPDKVFCHAQSMRRAALTKKGRQP